MLMLLWNHCIVMPYAGSNFNVNLEKSLYNLGQTPVILKECRTCFIPPLRVKRSACLIDVLRKEHRKLRAVYISLRLIRETHA